MIHDYKQEIRDWFADGRQLKCITDWDLFFALDVDPEFDARFTAFMTAIHEMIDTGELDTYEGELHWTPPIPLNTHSEKEL